MRCIRYYTEKKIALRNRAKMEVVCKQDHANASVDSSMSSDRHWYNWRLSHTVYQPIRSLESLPRREMASGHRRNRDVPVVRHPSPGFTRSAVTHTGVTATEALQLAEDRPFWWTIATTRGFGWTLRVMMMMMMISKYWESKINITIGAGTIFGWGAKLERLFDLGSKHRRKQ